VIIPNQQIDVDADVVDGLDVDFFKFVEQTCLIDVLLKRMEIYVESLILTHDRTPKINNLVHWILFPSC